jgi:hypothetical protein
MYLAYDAISEERKKIAGRPTTLNVYGYEVRETVDIE